MSLQGSHQSIQSGGLGYSSKAYVDIKSEDFANTKVAATVVEEDTIWLAEIAGDDIRVAITVNVIHSNILSPTGVGNGE